MSRRRCGDCCAAACAAICATRLQHIGDARLDLLDAENDAAAAAAQRAARLRPGRLGRDAAGSLAARLLAIGAIVGGARRPASAADRHARRARVRLSLELPAHIALASDYAVAVRDRAGRVADRDRSGRRQTTRRLYIRGLDDLVAARAAGHRRRAAAVLLARWRLGRVLRGSQADEGAGRRRPGR